MNRELLEMKGKGHDSDGTVYLTTTRRGRKRKAHIMDDEGRPLCRCKGKKWKKLDSATVEKFYSVCGTCENLSS